MNKYMCASIINLHKLKSCTRTAARCSKALSCRGAGSWDTHTHGRYRWWLSFCVVMQYDFKKHLIKVYLDVCVGFQYGPFFDNFNNHLNSVLSA